MKNNYEIDNSNEDFEILTAQAQNSQTQKAENSSQLTRTRTIILEKGDNELGMGFSVVGGHNSPLGNLPIYVKNVFNGSALNKLKRGDQIVAVDGISLENLSHHEVVAILKQTKETVTLSIMS